MEMSHMQGSTKKAIDMANDIRQLNLLPVRARLFSETDDMPELQPSLNNVENNIEDIESQITCLDVFSGVKELTSYSRHEAAHCKRNLFTEVKVAKQPVDGQGEQPIQDIQREGAQSSSQEDIVDALECANIKSDLVGDYSRPHTLPLVQGKHADLKAISPGTMAAVLRGDYDKQLGHVVVVDCRYPFEYEGGHIEGALNLYTHKAILEIFVNSDHHHKCSEGLPTALIFHCEFSSERGPKMLRYLREQDRSANSHSYPSLHFPEIYVLEGGYKAFWEASEGDHCSPSGYVPMLHEDHSEEVKFYRAMNKSAAKGSKRQRGRKLQCIVGTELLAATRTLDF